MRLLCISDREDSVLYGPTLNAYAEGAEAVISCGDLPFDYLEYIVTFLGVPLYYVLGNHDPDVESSDYPGGCIPLDGKVVDIGRVVVAGLSGSVNYSNGANQYTERQMRRKSRALSTRITAGALLGRPKPTIFVSHSPPYGVGDGTDFAHRGFKSFLPLMDRHRPGLWLHGHVHLYGARQTRLRRHGETKVINVYSNHFIDA